MRFPLLGPSYPSYVKSANNRALINFFLEQDVAGKSPTVAIPTPGLDVALTLPTFPNRGIKYVTETAQSGNRGFAVGGNKLYEISGGVAAERGTLASNTGITPMDNGVGQLVLVDGINLYVYNLVTGSFTTIAASTFNGAPINVFFINNYIIVLTRKSYYWSAINDATQWDGSDFKTPEGKPDSIRGALTINNEIRFFGDRTLEIHIGSGDSPDPFVRSGNTFAERGCVSRDSICKLDNAAFWLGEDEEGGYIVWRASGYSPVRVSTHALENAMRKMTTVYDASAMSIVWMGHSFYVLSFPTANETWAYDVATGIWFQWLYWNGVNYERHRGHVVGYGNGVTLLGDWQNGNIYKLNQDKYTDNGQTIRRLIRTQPINTANKLQLFRALEIDMEQGQGLESNEAPQVMLRYSDDGGFSWSNEHWLSSGKIGEYNTRMIWRRLGSAYNRVFELIFSDPVKTAVTGATIEMEIGK